MAQMYRLEKYLRQKLIESGWKDDLKKVCKGILYWNSSGRST